MFYEAIVTNSAPDDQMPGYIKVKVPGLCGELELPFLVGPIYPGWTAGGWHSTPKVEVPSGDDETQARVIVVQMAPNVFRYIGTTQGWSEIEDSAGESAGMRSFDGSHSILVDADGVRITGFQEESRVNIKSGEVQISSPTIKLTSSLSGSTPTEPLILGQSFLSALQTFLQGCVADAAMSPGTAAAASVFLVGVTSSLSAKAPYLSSVSETE